MSRKALVLGAWSSLVIGVAGCAGTSSQAAAITPQPSPSPDAATVAYQTLWTNDDNTMANSTSNHCNTIQDTGCPAAVARVLVTLQRWLQDLNTFSTPARFVTIDSQARKHLSAAIADLNAIVTANRAKKQGAEDLALQVAITERHWLDEISSGIARWHEANAASYSELVKSEDQALNACGGCEQLIGANPMTCTGHIGEDCEAAIVDASDYVANFESAVVQAGAPTSMATRDATLQSDLARLDSALQAMKAALVSLNQSGFNAGRASYQEAASTVAADVAAI